MNKPRTEMAISGCIHNFDEKRIITSYVLHKSIMAIIFKYFPVDDEFPYLKQISRIYRQAAMYVASEDKSNLSALAQLPLKDRK